VLKLYKYHLFCVGCALLAGRLFPQQLQAFDESYASMILHPGTALLRASLLVYQPNLLDVLPLYIVYLPCAWLLIRAEKDASPWVPIAALVLWAIQQTEVSAFGRWVSPGAFNVFSYQVVFFLGLWAARGMPRWAADRAGRFSPLLVGAVVVSGLCFLLSHSKHLVLPLADLEPAAEILKPHYGKFSLGWLRLLNFGAVALLLQQLKPWLSWLPWRPVAALGRRSLGVFTGHVAVLILFCGPVLSLRNMSSPLVLLVVLLPVTGLAFALSRVDRHSGASQRTVTSKRTHSRWLTLAIVSCLAPLLGMVFIGMRAALREVDIDFTAHPSQPALPTTGPLKLASSVTLESDTGDRIRAWWLEGKHRAPIVFVHGTDAARDQLLPEAEVLQEAGFSVMLLDLPGHGESSGKPRWGRPERSAIRAAIGFASGRAPGVGVGLFAFSAGAMVAAQEASANDRVQTVVLTGVPADFDNHIMAVYSRWGWLSSYPAVWAAHLAGYRNDAPTTVEAVAKVSRVLVVTGTADTIVPFSESLRVFQAAREPKVLQSVAGAKHGDYLQVLGRGAYGQLVTRFFEEHLLPGHASGTAQVR
jgi:hypothetical protein